MIDDTFKALADPTRRRILEILQGGELPAGKIASAFRLSKPSVSHHLTLLRIAGLVSRVRRGQSIVYALETSVLREVLGWLGDLESGPRRP